MLVSHPRTLCIEIFKVLKKLNPAFMNDIFSFRTSNYLLRNPKNLNRFRSNQVTFGFNSLKVMGPKKRNCLLNEFKSAENLNSLKNMIKQWNGPTNMLYLYLYILIKNMIKQCNVCQFNNIR